MFKCAKLCFKVLNVFIAIVIFSVEVLNFPHRTSAITIRTDTNLEPHTREKKQYWHFLKLGTGPEITWGISLVACCNIGRIPEKCYSQLFVLFLQGFHHFLAKFTAGDNGSSIHFRPGIFCSNLTYKLYICACLIIILVFFTAM